MPQQILDELHSNPTKIPLKIKLLHLSSLVIGLLCFASWMHIQNRYQDDIHAWTDWLLTLEGEGLLSISLIQASMLYLNFSLLIYLFIIALFFKDMRKEIYNIKSFLKIIAWNLGATSLLLICLGYFALLFSWFVLYFVPANSILIPINLACFIMYSFGFGMLSILSGSFILIDK